MCFLYRAYYSPSPVPSPISPTPPIAPIGNSALSGYGAGTFQLTFLIRRVFAATNFHISVFDVVGFRRAACQVRIDPSHLPVWDSGVNTVDLSENLLPSDETEICERCEDATLPRISRCFPQCATGISYSMHIWRSTSGIFEFQDLTRSSELRNVRPNLQDREACLHVAFAISLEWWWGSLSIIRP